MTRRVNTGRGAAVLFVAAVLVVGATGCPVVALKVTPSSAMITITGTVQLTGIPADGLIWSSSNTAVATVDSTTGLVTGVSAGTATITAIVPIYVLGQPEPVGQIDSDSSEITVTPFQVSD